MNKLIGLLAGAAALCVLAAMPANATLVTSVGALGPDDSIDWGQLGPALTTLTGPQAVTSVGGKSAIVSSIGNSFQRVDQTTGGWAGNFTPGDHLLWDNQVGPDITITFATPVSGVGAQIQANYLGAFVARITLSNGDTFTEAGTSTFSGDGSAIFIGALDASADILSIAFTLDSAFDHPEDFAIDTLYITTGAAGVPEPMTLTLFGAGLAGLGALRRRRKAKA